MTNSPYGSAAHQLACELAAMTLASETGGHNSANDAAIERLIARAREIAAGEPCNTPSPIAGDLISRSALADGLRKMSDSASEGEEHNPDDEEWTTIRQCYDDAIRVVEAAPAATIEAASATTATPDYEEEPEERRTGLYRVRFFMLTTTCDRHSVQVRASSPEAAMERVDAWRRDLIDLTDAEQETETLDKEMDVTDSEYDGLALEAWDAPTELEAPDAGGEAFTVTRGDPLAAAQPVD